MTDLPVANFTTDQDGDSPATCPSPGMAVGSQVAINGSTDLSAIITCVGPNDGNPGFVNWITLQYHDGEYPYQFQINGQGPSGFGSGALKVTFTDAAGGTDYIKLVSSTPYTHTLDYTSSQPSIVKIEWDNTISADEDDAE